MKRSFHIVYTILALNFFIPVAIYVFDPSTAVSSFADVGAILGGGGYPHTEDSMFWRVLAIANVMTLGFCCVLLQVDLERFYSVLYPLVFLKSMAALGFGLAFAFEPHPSFIAASIFDSMTVLAMVWFARQARAELQMQGSS